ncbi:MAG TPA: OmpH family outer membrane protein [Polyangiaceae bacterium]|nr:OmpH family outer membrane protein [Polyangiaceae bacterium]
MKHVHLRALALTLFLGLAAPSAFAQQLKFAVVDVQRAVMETEEGLRAQATLKKFFDKRQQELDAKQTELQKQREEIEKQSKVLSQQALQKRMEEWQKQMLELQTVFVEYNKELQKKQGELTQPIYGKMMGLLRRLATQDGYDAILEKQAVPYMRNDLDLTDRVIQMYNGGGAAPAGSGAPAAAPAAVVPKSAGKP